MNIYKEDSYFVIEHIYDDGRSNAQLCLPFNSAYLENIEDNVVLIRSAKNNDVICTTTLDNLTINDEAVSLETLYEDFDAVATSAGGGPGPGPVGPDWFTVTNLTDVDGSVGFLWGGSRGAPNFTTVEYSLDGENWTVWDPSIWADLPLVYLTLPANGNLYFRNGDLYNTAYARVKFYCNVDYKVSGKLAHLSDLVMGTTSTFYQFLDGNSIPRQHLIDAGDLILPDIIAPEMFYGLFRYQKKMTTAPTLPATALQPHCYREMFSNCTSLTTAPALPATTLPTQCYQEMFSDCTSLTTAPVLSAATVGSGSYQLMFRRCSSLNYIKCLATDISQTAALNQWVNGVSATGTFEKTAGVNWPTGISGIPDGWTVVEV